MVIIFRINYNTNWAISTLDYDTYGGKISTLLLLKRLQWAPYCASTKRCFLGPLLYGRGKYHILKSFMSPNLRQL